jgi:hypothetical protein
VEIPARTEQKASDLVSRQLERELERRGLLLSPAGLIAAEADARERGARLLTSLVRRCYPVDRVGGALALEFERDRDAARVTGALAFGAATAGVLAPGEATSDVAESVELLCAIFNLGIGLVDGLCDGDPERGAALLELVHQHDVARATEEPRGRGWLRNALPPALSTDHAVPFTVDVIETFFETLHAVYGGAPWAQYRRTLGRQLATALEAERQTVIGSASGKTLEQLMTSSRLTSVLPFQVIETLVGCAPRGTGRTAGTFLGDAMWRIDDLVDLSQDARSGALNGVLLASSQELRGRGDARSAAAALEQLLGSTTIARAAAEAADDLLAGLQLAVGRDRQPLQDHRPTQSFLYFIERYVGIAPESDS